MYVRLLLYIQYICTVYTSRTINEVPHSPDRVIDYLIVERERDIHYAHI